MNLRKIRPWAFYFLAWTLIGLIYFAQNVTRRFYWDDPEPLAGPALLVASTSISRRCSRR